MPDTKAEERLRAELTAILASLEQWRPVPEAAAQSLERLAGNLVDDAQTIEALDRNQLGYSRLAQRARRLTIALGRLRDGRYGRCDECGEPIPAARLHALLGVTTCVRCQEKVERQTGPGHR